MCCELTPSKAPIVYEFSLPTYSALPNGGSRLCPRARQILSLGAAGDGSLGKLNSLPFYYGTLTALWCIIPSALLVLVWNMFDGSLIEHLVLKPLPASIVGDNGERATLVYNQILNLAAGHLESEQIDPQLLAAVAHLGQLRTTNTWAMASTGLCVGMFSALLVWLRIAPQLKARAQVEVIFRWALLVCASLAVLTTVGIILSVLFESIRFFDHVSVFSFYSAWSGARRWPSAPTKPAAPAASAPCFFLGTLLIAALALLVAVPTGLMSAIYLSEYASRRTRNIVKPALEVLAGVPTVVYGFLPPSPWHPWCAIWALAWGLISGLPSAQRAPWPQAW